VDRRAFIGTLAGGLLAAPLAGGAQQPAKSVPGVGILLIASREAVAPAQRALEEAFRELGHVPGRQISLEYRFAGGDPERLRQFAAELVQLPVDVIIAGTNPAVAAPKQATSGIPIVMGSATNVIRTGFLQSLAKPGSNTGLTVDPAPETFLVKQLYVAPGARSAAVPRTGCCGTPRFPAIGITSTPWRQVLDH
jgi:putative ABC transport system substrate-binding protein